jgi:hypothetical protein
LWDRNKIISSSKNEFLEAFFSIKFRVSITHEEVEYPPLIKRGAPFIQFWSVITWPDLVAITAQLVFTKGATFNSTAQLVFILRSALATFTGHFLEEVNFGGDYNSTLLLPNLLSSCG